MELLMKGCRLIDWDKDFYGDIYIVKAFLAGGFGIRKRNVFKFHRAVGNAHDWVLGVFYVAFFGEEFIYTLRTCTRNCNHDKEHREHHEAGKNLHRIGDKAHKLARAESCGRVVAAGDNCPCAKPGDEKHACIYAKLHKRHVEGEGFFCL